MMPTKLAEKFTEAELLEVRGHIEAVKCFLEQREGAFVIQLSSYFEDDLNDAITDIDGFIGHQYHDVPYKDQ